MSFTNIGLNSSAGSIISMISSSRNQEVLYNVSIFTISFDVWNLNLCCNCIALLKANVSWDKFQAKAFQPFSFLIYIYWNWTAFEKSQDHRKNKVQVKYLVFGWIVSNTWRIWEHFGGKRPPLASLVFLQVISKEVF